MRIGIFISEINGHRTGIDELLANATQAESLGFTTGWVPHIPWSHDSLTVLALAGQVTSTIELGTAVIPTYPRHPLAMAQQALSTQAAAGGRLVLGIGPSHPVMIEGMFGLPYERPARHVREYVEVLRAAFECSGRVDYEGDLYHVKAMLEVPDATAPSIMVAALAPKMLQLAGELTDGTITYWANERALTDHVVPSITAAAHDAGRPAPRVVAGLPIGVCDDAAAGREEAARVFEAYLAIPTYQRVLARGGDAAPADVAVIGTEEEVTTRLRSFASAGVTDLMAAPLALGDDHDKSRARTMELLASLAPEL